MYVFLFNLAGWAMVGWLLMIVLPAWRVTRWIVRTSAFPVFLSLLYVVGIVALLARMGPGMMADFGNAEGVMWLLGNPDLALVAWIHLLAFDQAVALMIYRDNLQHRWIPLPLQSVVLVATLMLGPVGLLSYLGLRRLSRSRRAARAQPAETAPVVGRITAEDGVAAAVRQAAGGVLAAWRREWALTSVALLGLALGAACAVAIAVRGSQLVAPEGHLRKAMTFDVAIGIYLLTLALCVPLARFSARGLAVWRAFTVLVMLYVLVVETGQIARGLDPRFSRAGGIPDQLLGAGMFLGAIGIMVLFGVMAWAIVRRRLDGADGPLLLALRWGAVSTFAAFAAGFWMSAVQGSKVGAGSILPLHAAGFHGLQALPLVAILLTWAGMRAGRAHARIHAAGAAWLAACAAIAWQTAAGRPVTEFSPAMALAAAALLAWAAVAALAARAWLAAAPASPAPAQSALA
ncbi:MAG TPA: ABA4-like family protein [Longimicrobium sp.]|nr:ABA4-like family protein [Longimicrobium sp.]